MPRPPRRPMLSLSIREVTSVTATFILSSKLDSSSDPTPASLGIDEEGSDEESKESTSNSTSNSKEVVNTKPPSTSTPKHKSKSSNNTNNKRTGKGAPPSNGIIAQTVYKLLFLTVNGIRWQRAVVKIDDRLDEAIIIIFGLVQGREYEIEFLVAVDEKTARERAKEMERELGDGLERRVEKVVNFEEMVNVQEVEKAGELGIREERKLLEGGEGEKEDQDFDEVGEETTLTTATLRTQLVTKETDADEHSPSSTDVDINNADQLLQPSPTPQPLSTTAQLQSTTCPPPDRLTHLQQTLTSLTTERDSVLASLKSLRRESQKTDASLRAEIEALKRTSEKHLSTDLRGRQKILALQESIKRAQQGASESESQGKEANREAGEIISRCVEREGEYGRIKGEAEKAKKERDEVVEKGRRKVENLKTEMSGLVGKLERLCARKEKMDGLNFGGGGSLRVLEKKVRDVEDEIENLEQAEAEFEKEKDKDKPVLVWPPPPMSSRKMTIGSTSSTPPTTTTTTVEPVGAGRPRKSATMQT